MVPTACQTAQVKKTITVSLANIINNHLFAVALQVTRYEILVSLTLDEIRRKLIRYSSRSARLVLQTTPPTSSSSLSPLDQSMSPDAQPI